jgi:TrmH family RNA methyltransferase
MERIASPRNALLKQIRALGDSPRERRNSGKILLDGVHLLKVQLRQRGLSGITVLVSDSGLGDPEISAILAAARHARIVHIPDALFAKVSPVRSPTGVMAIVDMPRSMEDADEPFWVVLDGVQDPGNLGSMLRTAASAAASCALLSSDCADPWSPKSLRGGMGAQLVLPVREEASLVDALRMFPGRIFATTPHSDCSIFQVSLAGPVALLFGGEGRGLKEEVLAQAHARVSIPGHPDLESLNVAAAAAVCCFERVRQLTRRST